MVSGICGKLTSYLPKVNLERLVVLGISGIGYALSGLPGMIASIGGFYFASPYLRTLPASSLKRSEEAVQLPIPFTSKFFDDQKREIESRPVDLSARLFSPNKAPTQVQWKHNSCFCSAAIWTFFTNEPAVLGEIPEAIARRLDKRNLFHNGIEAVAGRSSPEQITPLFSIYSIIEKRTPLTLADLISLRQGLADLEKCGFPDGVNVPKLQELLSLLELHSLIREFQTSKGSISGDRVNEIRKIVLRVNANFQGISSLTGDAHEVFQTLANLVFDGSKFQQTMTTTRTDIRQGSSFVMQPEKRSNWGDFLLPMPKPGSRSSTLQSILQNYLAPANPIHMQVGPQKLSYFMKESQTLETAPPFLALTLNRAQPSEAGVQRMNMGAIDVDPHLDLESSCFEDRRSAHYELVGVARHLGNFSHYDAAVNKSGIGWHYCNDLKNPSVYPFKASEVSEFAKTGYMFFYRKIDLL